MAIVIIIVKVYIYKVQYPEYMKIQVQMTKYNFHRNVHVHKLHDYDLRIHNIMSSRLHER